MARKVDQLKATSIKINKPGLYPDGKGLYLQITSPAAKSWLFRFARNGRERQMGLGSASTINLAEAREAARSCRKQLMDGLDPIEQRKLRQQQALAETAKAMTFDDCVAAYITAHEPSWRNPVHRAQWRSSIQDYVSPVFGKLPVSSIDTGLVLKALEPHWTKVPVTAQRIRGRIESVLDWAGARGYRSGTNPAAWKGHLENLLAAPAKVRKVQHHAALPYAELPEFMASLRAQEGVTERALEFTILTAARTNETLGARWNEIDRQAGVWIVPAERMKAGKEHRVPLSKEALAILDQMQGVGGEFVFPGRNGGRSAATMFRLLSRMGRPDLTVHGFRSTFRTWAAERTSYPHDVCEAALAHQVPDAVVRSYKRTDLFDKRRRLMDEWSRFATSPAQVGTVVSLRSA